MSGTLFIVLSVAFATGCGSHQDDSTLANEPPPGAVLIDDSNPQFSKYRLPNGAITYLPKNSEGAVPHLTYARGTGAFSPDFYDYQASRYAQAGYGVSIAPDYMVNFGGQDAERTTDAALQAFPNLLDPNRLAIGGHSQGGAAAINAAANGRYQAVIGHAPATAFTPRKDLPADYIGIGSSRDQWGQITDPNHPVGEGHRRVVSTIQGGHEGPYIGTIQGPEDDMVVDATLGFLNCAFTPNHPDCKKFEDGGNGLFPGANAQPPQGKPQAQQPAPWGFPPEAGQGQGKPQAQQPAPSIFPPAAEQPQPPAVQPAAGGLTPEDHKWCQARHPDFTGKCKRAGYPGY